MKLNFFAICAFAVAVASPITALAQGKALGIPWPTFHHDPQHTGLSHFDTSTNSGSLAWKLTAGNVISSSPAVGADNTIYIGSADNSLDALNPDGTEKWAFATGGFIESSPGMGRDGTVYFGSRDFNFYALGG